MCQLNEISMPEILFMSLAYTHVCRFEIGFKDELSDSIHKGHSLCYFSIQKAVFCSFSPYLPLCRDLLATNAARKLSIPKQTAETRSAGVFVASSVAPAFETVMVKKSGMLCWIQTGIVRLAAESATAVSVGSEMGGVRLGSLCI